MTHILADDLVVVDFETTGLSPDNGDRAIEIGAVRLRNGQPVETFQALMNPGRRVNSFIEQYTGITNQMLADAAPNAEVMEAFLQFLGSDNLLAHNASFDKKFLDAEFLRIDRQYSGQFACSLLTSRRVFDDAPNHKLGTLVSFKNLHQSGNFHRALFDAQMTAKLWVSLLHEVRQQLAIDVIDLALMQTISKASRRDWQLQARKFLTYENAL
ncbi:3'-5' exonuclease [Thalassotalea mangrovi]|uniref:DNA-directed DNA polymerase n=1 Tax=Thalassotalea mangrovi TaxID=2572245 RepID=A0A4U1B5T4_9GAMM|nr:3'-5' exonuclease [Thalassotalea mangrovi]TKB45743.1 3'-5' exonuclease [Thalassotalea mangrovi]